LSNLTRKVKRGAEHTFSYVKDNKMMVTIAVGVVIIIVIGLIMLRNKFAKRIFFLRTTQTYLGNGGLKVTRAEAPVDGSNVAEGVVVEPISTNADGTSNVYVVPSNADNSNPTVVVVPAALTDDGTGSTPTVVVVPSSGPSASAERSLKGRDNTLAQENERKLKSIDRITDREVQQDIANDIQSSNYYRPGGNRAVTDGATDERFEDEKLAQADIAAMRTDILENSKLCQFDQTCAEPPTADGSMVGGFYFDEDAVGQAGADASDSLYEGLRHGVPHFDMISQ